MSDTDQKQLSLESEPEEIEGLFAKLVVFLQRVNRKWIDTTARKLSEEDIREYVRRDTEFGGKPDIARLLHAYVVTKALLDAGSSIIEFVDELPSPNRRRDDEGCVIGQPVTCWKRSMPDLRRMFAASTILMAATCPS
jgi:hypothetical protein